MTLGVSRDSRWKELRHKITHAFSSSKLKQMLEQLTPYIDLFDEYLDKRLDADGAVEVELKGAYEKLALDIVGSCFLGLDLQNLNSNDDLRLALKTVFAASWRRTAHRILKVTCPSLLRALKWHEISRAGVLSAPSVTE